MLVLPNSSDKIVLQMVERTIVCTCILVFVCFAMVLQTMLTFNGCLVNSLVTWYCVLYTPVMWHRIVGLMTLALDSMIEPSQSNAYPEASTILRSIVYSSSKLQGEPGWYDQVCRYYTYFCFVPQCSLSVLSCSVLCSAICSTMCSVMRDAVPHAVVL